MLVSPLCIWNIPYKNLFKVIGTRHFTIPINYLHNIGPVYRFFNYNYWLKSYISKEGVLGNNDFSKGSGVFTASGVLKNKGISGVRGKFSVLSSTSSLLSSIGFPKRSAHITYKFKITENYKNNAITLTNSHIYKSVWGRKHHINLLCCHFIDKRTKILIDESGIKI